jgi:hypothetical protein
VDPCLFFADPGPGPGPELDVRDRRGSGCWSGSGSGSGPMRIRGFGGQGLKKGSYSRKKLLFILFFIKSCNLHIPRPPWGMTKLWKRPSVLKRGHPALQKKNMNICKLLSTFEGQFCPPGSGSGSGFWTRIRVRIRCPGWVRIRGGSGSRFRIRIHNTAANKKYIT